VEGRGISLAPVHARRKSVRLSEVPTIEYPEDPLMESFHARNPDVRLLMSSNHHCMQEVRRVNETCMHGVQRKNIHACMTYWRNVV
jgi:hypothetical protein